MVYLSGVWMVNRRFGGHHTPSIHISHINRHQSPVHPLSFNIIEIIGFVRSVHTRKSYNLRLCFQKAPPQPSPNP